LTCVVDVTVAGDGWCDEETEAKELIKDVLLKVTSLYINAHKHELVAQGLPEEVLDIFLQLGESSWEEEESGENDDGDDDDDDDNDSDDSEEDTNDDK
jgi:hypothetical protein